MNASSVTRLGRFVQVTFAISFALPERRPSPVLQVYETTREQKDGPADSEPRRRPGSRVEECRRYDVLNLRRAGKRVHRKSKRAERNGRVKKSLRNVRYAEQFGCKWIDREYNYKKRYASVCENAADDDYRDNRVSGAKNS